MRTVKTFAPYNHRSEALIRLITQSKGIGPHNWFWGLKKTVLLAVTPGQWHARSNACQVNCSKIFQIKWHLSCTKLNSTIGYPHCLQHFHGSNQPRCIWFVPSLQKIMMRSEPLACQTSQEYINPKFVLTNKALRLKYQPLLNRSPGFSLGLFQGESNSRGIPCDRTRPTLRI